MRNWLFVAAAGLPCIVLLVFCGAGIHEWWLVSTNQIAVIPAPTRGTAWSPQVPASSLLPLIFASGALAAAFALALVRGSRRVLLGAYVAVVLVVGLAVLQHWRA